MTTTLEGLLFTVRELGVQRELRSENVSKLSVQPRFYNCYGRRTFAACGRLPHTSNGVFV